MYPFPRFKFSIPLLFTTNLKELKSKLKDMNRGMGIVKGEGRGRGNSNSNDRDKGLDKGELSSSFFLYYLFGILSTYFLSSHHKNL